MRKFRKYTATALVAMMVAGMTMSGYQQQMFRQVRKANISL